MHVFGMGDEAKAPQENSLKRWQNMDDSNPGPSSCEVMVLTTPPAVLHKVEENEWSLMFKCLDWSSLTDFEV